MERKRGKKRHRKAGNIVPKGKTDGSKKAVKYEATKGGGDRSGGGDPTPGKRSTRGCPVEEARKGRRVELGPGKGARKR